MNKDICLNTRIFCRRSQEFHILKSLKIFLKNVHSLKAWQKTIDKRGVWGAFILGYIQRHDKPRGCSTTEQPLRNYPKFL